MCGLEARACSDSLQHAYLRSSLLHGQRGFASNPFVVVQSGGSRSIPLAFGFSAVVPGLGQVYNRHWTKAIGAAVVEAIVITTWATARSRGLNAEDDFIKVAHNGWDPSRYAAWLDPRWFLLLQSE